MELRPARIEDVPVLELSGLALSDGTPRPDLLAIGEPAGKPEGLVVTADGTFIVGLDTRTPEANLCWYPR